MVGRPGDVPPSPSWMWPLEKVCNGVCVFHGSRSANSFVEQNNDGDGVLEYTMEMWAMVIFDTTRNTSQTGFTLYEQRLNFPKWSNRVSGNEGFSVCGQNYENSNTIYGCDHRRNSVMYSHEKGWMWNYGYALNSAFRFHIPIDTPSYDRQRVRVESGKPFHIALTFQAVAAAQIGPKTNYDDQIATLYVNGIRVGNCLVYYRKPSETFGWYIGSWQGVFPNTTAKTITVTESSSPYVIDTSAVEGLIVDEVRIWRNARSQAQIISNMHQPISASDPDLVMYYNFDDANETVSNTSTLPRGRDYSAYLNTNFNSSNPDRYLGVQSYDEGLYPLFEESFVPTSTNWSQTIPRNSVVYLDALVSSYPFFPLIHFAAAAQVIGNRMYVYGGSTAFLAFGAPVGTSDLRVYDMTLKRWLVTPQPLGAPETSRRVVASASVVDGTKIWYFGGSFDYPVLCVLETNSLPYAMDCPTNTAWNTLVGTRAGMGSLVIGRDVWLFGGAILQSASVVGVDNLVRFNLDTQEVQAFTNPLSQASWPPARMFPCLAPFGTAKNKIVLYGGITGFTDSGSLKTVYVLDTTISDTAKMFEVFPLEDSKIPTVSGWSSCSYVSDTMILFSGTTGYSVTGVFTFTSTAAVIDDQYKLNTITLFRLNSTNPSSSFFETMSPNNGFTFTGGPLPLRLAHTAALTPDGGQLIFLSGIAIDNRAEKGDKPDIYTDRGLYHLRLGCASGTVPGSLNDTDPFSYTCVSCPAGTYQPVSYPRDTDTLTCTPCPAPTYSSSGAVSCTLCPLNTISTTVGASSNSTCKPCPEGFQTTKLGDTECTQIGNSAVSGPPPYGAIFGGLAAALIVVGAAIVVGLIMLRRWRAKLESS